ncbi:MAG: peptidase [Lachnospiraceae bacterium]|nr:peptidase [Lachnospiraceae bacterium]
MFKKRRKPVLCLRRIKAGGRKLVCAALMLGMAGIVGGCSAGERLKEELQRRRQEKEWKEESLEALTETQEEERESTERTDASGIDISPKESPGQTEGGGALTGEGEAEGETGETQGEAKALVLPRRWDYREMGKQPEAGDQGKFGTCWAFASLMAIESSLLPEEQWSFSADHMSRKNSFSMAQEDGGQYAMSMAYLLAWQGPVLEADDPYGDGYSPDGLLPVKHVQEVRLLASKDYLAIKEAVYQTGGVQSSLYTQLKDYTSRDKYYNEETCGYYYDGEEKPNHNVVIIGWDDDYPKENFKQQPKKDGAFICLNSWGPKFGEQGCFYVSYEDTNIGDTNVLYTKITDPRPEERIYQSDLCGWIGQIGYGEESAYFSAVYQAKEAEELTAVGFYATLPDTRYTVYAAKASSPKYMALTRPAAKGSFKEAGFYTVELSAPVQLKAGETFTIVVDIETPGAVHPVAIEYQAPDLTGKVDLSDGEGYLSSDGKKWVSAEENQSCNLCLKAYTQVIEKTGQ